MGERDVNESTYTRKKIMPVIRERGGVVTKKVAGPRSAVGMPDLLGCYLGRALAWEVKLPNGSYGVTEKQQDTLDAWEAAGADVAVIRTPDEVRARLDAIEREADDDSAG